MKKIILFYVLILLSCTSQNQFNVSGELENAEGMTIKLYQRVGRSYEVIDSSLVTNNHFQLSGNVEHPDFYFLGVQNNEEMRKFFLENSNITIQGNIDSLEKLTISGSKTQDKYEQYNELVKPFDDRIEILYQEYQQIMASGEVDKLEGIYTEYEIIMVGITQISMNFIRDNPNSFVSGAVLGQLAYDMEANELEEMLNTLHKKVKVMPAIEELEKRLTAMKNTEIGQPAPNFEMNDAEGNLVQLADKIGSKLLLLDFWASWCKPCRDENPNVVAVYNEFHKMGFNILGISLDKDKLDWLDAVQQDKLVWDHVSDLAGWDCSAAAKYNVSSIPANFLLDENGIIIAKNLRGEDLEKEIKKRLEE